MSDLIERLRSNAALPICPFEKRSPEYYTTPNDKPCKFCGGEPEGPDKCTGADMRVMLEASDRIAALEAENERLRKALEFYADRGFDGYDVDLHSYGLGMEKGEIIKDGGDIARSALEAAP